MARFLIPLLLMMLGVGGGAAAGLMLQPAPEPPNPCGETAGEAGPPALDTEAATDAGQDGGPGGADEGEAKSGGEAGGGAGTGGRDYVRLDNQFVVPVVQDGDVASLVILSLSVEVPAGGEDAVLTAEPVLRNAFLQVLFDHANTGGFDGLFTATSVMRTLRGALLSAARDELGAAVTDVLITDIVRQDQ